MSGERTRWLQVRDIFDEASEKTEAERAAFLDARCGDDTSLRREVEDLLAADAKAASVLRPRIGDAAQELLEPGLGPQETLGPYRLEGELGRGGMGVVYRAVRDDGEYRQRVAIKVMSRFLTTEVEAQRFRTERQILADLEHPSIARLLDGGTTADGAPYLVMEFVEGEPIDRHCKDRQASLEERLRLVLQVADAVAHAHARLVVHRDLKPANILVTPQGVPKLLDFGIAKILDAESLALATRTGTLALTPRYASPEQVASEAITVATDVYSLGIILYELLSGVSPYGDESLSSPAGLARAISEKDPLRLSAAARQAGEGAEVAAVPARRLEGDLDAIVGTALRKEPSRRYASIEHFAADLRRFLAGQPVTAVPDSFLYRSSKWLRRNVVPAALGALAVLALIGGLIARTTEAQRAEQEKERANLEAAISEQVTVFLEGVFDSAAPVDATRRDVSARELLDAAVGRIDQVEEPLVRARVLRVMGRAYKELALFEEAEDLLRKALEALGESGQPKTRVLVNLALGNLLKEAQRPEEAIEVFQAALDDIPQTDLGEGSDHLKALHQMGLMLSHQGKLEAAEQTLLEAMDLARTSPSADRRSRVPILYNLGSVYADQGKLERAHEVILEGLELAIEISGPDHQAAVVGLINAGQSLIELGRLEDAERYTPEALERATSFLPEAHPLVAAARRNLGALRARQGRLEEAEPLLQQTLENHRKLYGDEQFLTQLVHSNVALVRLRQGRLDEADALLARALEAIEPAFGAEHYVVAEILHFQGEVRFQQGRVEEARELWGRALEIREMVYGPQGAFTLETRRALEALPSVVEPAAKPE